ncbi:hypothetical protein HD806DRAFT_455452 [Xylariaceae sp. AK1471]|nr:hypothetical protein HD806DRAFT_455452 [Xylariaceae sp. AK1471]
MLFKSTLVFTTAAVTFGLANAACTFTGYTNADCTGSKGAEDTVTSAGRCIKLTGRAAFYLSSDCAGKTVEIAQRTGAGCTGDMPVDTTLIPGCYRISDGVVSAFVSTY